jgi:hypothetical protein
MIDINDPAQFADLMLRVQARRVAQAYQGARKVIPAGAAAILADDTKEALDRDTAAFGAWCVAHGVECVRVLGISDFRAAVQT